MLGISLRLLSGINTLGLRQCAGKRLISLCVAFTRVFIAIAILLDQLRPGAISRQLGVYIFPIPRKIEGEVCGDVLRISLMEELVAGRDDLVAGTPHVPDAHLIDHGRGIFGADDQPGFDEFYLVVFVIIIDEIRIKDFRCRHDDGVHATGGERGQVLAALLHVDVDFISVALLDRYRDMTPSVLFAEGPILGRQPHYVLVFLLGVIAVAEICQSL